jgi:hypothetical protein
LVEVVEDFANQGPYQHKFWSHSPVIRVNSDISSKVKRRSKRSSS